MIIQVHDELNFSVYPEEKEKVEKIVVEEMQNAYQLSVPLVADAGWGNNWLEAHQKNQKAAAKTARQLKYKEARKIPNNHLASFSFSRCFT